jgi:hypothetical protein
MDNQIAVFEQKNIRHVEYNGETYFSVIDIIAALTDSNNPNRYWTDIKRRSEKETGQSYAFCVSLKMKGTDGKMYKTDCANTEGGDTSQMINGTTVTKSLNFAKSLTLWVRM